VEAPKAPAGGRKRKGQSLEQAVVGGVVGAFSATAYVTQHEHWFQNADQVAPITDPLMSWIDTLPVKTVKQIEQGIWPLMLLIGLVLVLLPCILAEIKLRGREANLIRQARAAGAAGLRIVPGDVAPEAGAGPGFGYGIPAANGLAPPEGSGQGADDIGRPPRLPGVPY
jgi:hypothetical protein